MAFCYIVLFGAARIQVCAIIVLVRQETWYYILQGEHGWVKRNIQRYDFHKCFDKPESNTSMKMLGEYVHIRYNQFEENQGDFSTIEKTCLVYDLNHLGLSGGCTTNKPEYLINLSLLNYEISDGSFRTKMLVGLIILSFRSNKL